MMEVMIMPHNYKRYTTEQLKEEEHTLKAKLDQALKIDDTNRIAINRRKIEIVQSFMLDQQQFKAGDLFELKHDASHLFKIDEMVGVIAWGYLVDPDTLEKIDPTDRIAKLLILLGEKR